MKWPEVSEINQAVLLQSRPWVRARWLACDRLLTVCSLICRLSAMSRLLGPLFSKISNCFCRLESLPTAAGASDSAPASSVRKAFSTCAISAALADFSRKAAAPASMARCSYSLAGDAVRTVEFHPELTPWGQLWMGIDNMEVVWSNVYSVTTIVVVCPSPKRRFDAKY